jgi:aspartyl-tRNA(Asn)/glutamyl-tRNA(Gln) amidotransferase subunit C
MEVNDQLIEKLAHLARLSFTDEEKESIKTDLQRMISFIHKMEEVNTDDVEPLLHITEAKNILRKDEVKGTVTTAEAMKNAPLNDGHFFKVPKVIRK